MIQEVYCNTNLKSRLERSNKAGKSWLLLSINRQPNVSHRRGDGDML